MHWFYCPYAKIFTFHFVFIVEISGGSLLLYLVQMYNVTITLVERVGTSTFIVPSSFHRYKVSNYKMVPIRGLQHRVSNYRMFKLCVIKCLKCSITDGSQIVTSCHYHRCIIIAMKIYRDKYNRVPL